jgi:acyl-CoA hydrolase
MRPSGFTNDPFLIARHDQTVAINSALAVDLTGQVAADTVRGRFFSGIGGQVDFIRGAAPSGGTAASLGSAAAIPSQLSMNNLLLPIKVCIRQRQSVV